MGGKLTRADHVILSLISEYRILTVKQLSALTARSFQVLRRRLRFLKEKNFVRFKERGFSNRPGRREDIITLAEAGFQLLKNEKSASANINWCSDKISDPVCIDHDLLRNWFFAHLIQIERENPQFEIKILINCFNILNGKKNIGYPHQERCLRANDAQNNLIMIPDGAFTITNNAKSLLFFLEVDMGTEPRVTPMRTSGDIRHKIICYQMIFREHWIVCPRWPSLLRRKETRYRKKRTEICFSIYDFRNILRVLAR